ncbi:NAD(P)/FAD-dependent oxidoreductase [Rubritalea marina]|uniref:NAD(P)/FAD-dependent oxidoreductase n=1 Tax=Rubritalea marina TaxID=361055 RepID=UPI0003649E3E|nr:NAD(P)/FAD-dependent oxidoreductase [Rubritalea marina]
MADIAVKKVVIIGGGFAGLECAKQLANKPTFEVTLIDRTNHHLFQPLLYQVATATLPSHDIARSLRSILDEADNVTVLMDEVLNVDSEAKSLTGRSGNTYDFDTLVVAAGAKTGYFGNDHWAEHTIGMKTLAEAHEIRERVLKNLETAEISNDPEERRRLMTIAIVGGGPTGVELSGAFVELIQRSMKRNFRRIDTSQLKVILIEAGPRLLPPYEEESSAYTQKRLEKLGVEVRTSTMVTDIEAGKVITKDTVIEAGSILWAAGVEAESIVSKLPVETNRAGKVTPDACLSLPGHRDIFVAGDVTFMKDANGVPVPGVAPAASQMGRFIGKLLVKEAVPGQENAERPGFVYWDKGAMAIVGRSHAVVEFGKIQLKGIIAWFAWLFIHILFLVDFRSKLSVFIHWLWNYVTDAPGVRVFEYKPEDDISKK